MTRIWFYASSAAHGVCVGLATTYYALQLEFLPERAAVVVGGAVGVLISLRDQHVTEKLDE